MNSKEYVKFIKGINKLLPMNIIYRAVHKIMGGAFTGNVYVFYACRFRLRFNDLSDVGTVWYFVVFYFNA